MKKFDLIDIDETALPDVNLSEDQKNSIRTKMKLNFNRFIEGNSSLSIDTSYENISRIEEELGETKNETLHSIKYANVLKELVLEAIEKDCPFKDDEILHKQFLYLGAGSEYDNIPAVWTNTPFYCQVYITNKTLLVYTLDNYFRLIIKRELPISDINSVGLTYKDCDGLKLSNENLIIKINSKKYPDFFGYYLLDKNPKDSSKLEKIKDLLISLGVKNYKQKKISGAAISYILFYIVFIVLFVSVIIKSLN